MVCHAARTQATWLSELALAGQAPAKPGEADDDAMDGLRRSRQVTEPRIGLPAC
jgi:hypothetical protein